VHIVELSIAVGEVDIKLLMLV